MTMTQETIIKLRRLQDRDSTGSIYLCRSEGKELLDLAQEALNAREERERVTENECPVTREGCANADCYKFGCTLQNDGAFNDPTPQPDTPDIEAELLSLEMIDVAAEEIQIRNMPLHIAHQLCATASAAHTYKADAKNARNAVMEIDGDLQRANAEIALLKEDRDKWFSQALDNKFRITKLEADLSDAHEALRFYRDEWEEKHDNSPHAGLYSTHELKLDAGQLARTTLDKATAPDGDEP